MLAFFDRLHSGQSEYERLVEFTRRLTGSADDAEDIVQDLVLPLARVAAQGRTITAKYARACARNRVRNAWRRQRTIVMVDLDTDPTPHVHADCPVVGHDDAPPDEGHDGAPRPLSARGAFGALTDQFHAVAPQCAAVIALYLRHCSYSEIAAQRGIAIGTVRTHVQRAPAIITTLSSKPTAVVKAEMRRVRSQHGAALRLAARQQASVARTLNALRRSAPRIAE